MLTLVDVRATAKKKHEPVNGKRRRGTSPEMAVFGFLWDGAWAIDTYGADGTKVIAVVFIFIAYVLHTGIALIFQKVRANGAWHAIEQHETVEVTEYSVLTRIFRCRGKWDVARITTVLLVVLTLASWGLELSMGLAYYEGDADILNRPPPVMLGYDERSDDVGYWQVRKKHCCGIVRYLPW